MQPRDYQEQVRRGVWGWYRANKGIARNPLVAMPTGTGKALVAAMLAKDIVDWGYRVAVVTHVKELIAQNYKTLERFAPDITAGIHSAGLNKRDQKGDVLFCGIQSVYRRAGMFQNVEFVIVDEAHLVPDKGMYQTLFSNIREKYNPNLKIIGLTATPYRLGMGMLTDGKTFDDVAVNMTTPKWWSIFIQRGYLTPLIPKQPVTNLDTSSIQMRLGDFVEKDVVAALDSQNITRHALEEILSHAENRKSWLMFASSIEHATRMAEILNKADIPSIAVHSKMPTEQRDAALKGYKEGKYRCIVNKDILTTGFDDPKTDCIILLRATQSPGLLVQMLGRGTRPSEGKENCLVLDFCNNVQRLGPIDNPTPPEAKAVGKKRKPGQKAMVPQMMKVCQKCRTFNPLAASECKECGAKLPISINHGNTASTDELLSGGHIKLPKPPMWLQVKDMKRYVHSKEGRKPMIRVHYICGARTIHQYVNPDTDNQFVRRKAWDWFQIHTNRTDRHVVMNLNAAQMLASPVYTPKRIQVDFNGQYPEVVGYEF